MTGRFPHPEAVKARLRNWPGYALAARLRGLIRSPQERGIALARLSGTRTIFQPYGTTWPDRYPQAFAFVRDRIGDGPDRRILSFGCSTGEEVFSLASYFRSASITGLDVNPYNIRQCLERWRREGGDPRLTFTMAASAEDEAPDSYDAIFAMAVFRHGRLGDEAARCDHLIRFAEFEQSVAILVRCLKPGGLLIVRYANFRFSDTAAAAGFQRVYGFGAKPFPPVYGPDNRRMAVEFSGDGVFQKPISAEVAPKTPQIPSCGGERPIPITLLVEVGLALTISRLLTQIPFRVAVRLVGFNHQPQPPPEIAPAQATTSLPPEAMAIGAAIRRVGRRVPFRTACLQQALAAALMLRRRRLPVEMHFSVSRDGTNTLAHVRTLSNHAIVTGADGGEGYRPIAVFTAR